VGMIRSAVAAVALIMLSGIALAQDATPRVQVFGGFSFLHEDTGRLLGLTFDNALRAPSDTFGIRSDFTGWTAEGQYNADRWVGIAADFGGHRGAPITALNTSGVTGLPNESEYYFLAGPVLSYRNKTRLTPFVHALFGWERTRLNATTITGLAAPEVVATTTYDDFTMALGGGLDCKIVKHVSLRVPQVDYFHTSLNLTKFYNDAFGPQLFQGLSTRQRNARVSGGIVLQF
jgi:opacity protein-like surface antigen